VILLVLIREDSLSRRFSGKGGEPGKACYRRKVTEEERPPTTQEGGRNNRIVIQGKGDGKVNGGEDRLHRRYLKNR